MAPNIEGAGNLPFYTQVRTFEKKASLTPAVLVPTAIKYGAILLVKVLLELRRQRPCSTRGAQIVHRKA